MTKRALLIATALLASSGFSAEDALPDVNVVVNLTAAGKKVPPPRPGHPVFYYPKVAPYADEGAPQANDQPPPPPAVIEHMLAVALAKQGYLFAAHRDPDIVLAILYGSLNPVFVSVKPPGKRSKSQQIIMNQPDMIAMIQGDDVSGVADVAGIDFPVVRKRLFDQLHFNRYFIMVTALDYKSFGPGKHPVILWRARISIPAIHVYFGDVIETLIKKGAPYFGRDTRPVQVEVPTLPEGHVEVGTPTLKNPQPPQ